MRNKYTTLFFSLVLLCSCAKEETTDQETESVKEDCTVDYAEDIRLLDSSLAAVDFYSLESDMPYKDNAGNIHTFQPSKEESSYWCLHSWTCDTDSTQTDEFWVARYISSKVFISTTSDYEFKFAFYSSLNHEEPLKYSDIFNIQIKLGDDHHCTVSSYVIDPRNDNTASNDHLIQQDQIEIGGFTYTNVFIVLNEDFEIIYNLELGLIEMKDLKNDVELRLNE